jgi:spermidine synthase
MAKEHFSHLVLDLFGCPQRSLQLWEVGRDLLLRVCEAADLNVVGQFHRQFPDGGYTIVFSLAESHLSLHTWPEMSFAAVDAFLCGGNLDHLETSIRSELRPKHVESRILKRGLRQAIDSELWIHSAETADYYEAFRATRVLLSRQSPHQKIEVFDHPTLGRVLMLDGDIQLSSSDEFVYHEWLVHPPMLAHKNPGKVLIIGGGDGGALQEVLKYRSVRSVTLIDIDDEVISVARRLLGNSRHKAFDDRRVVTKTCDAADFLRSTNECFDLVLSDLTAPSGPSVAAYQTLRMINGVLAKNAFVGMHSGWWSTPASQGFTAMIQRNFRHVCVTNQWIESFRCFWSFILAWSHNVSAREVVRTVSSAKPRDARSFTGSRYRDEVFTRAMPHEIDAKKAKV